MARVRARAHACGGKGHVNQLPAVGHGVTGGRCEVATVGYVAEEGADVAEVVDLVLLALSLLVTRLLVWAVGEPHWRKVVTEDLPGGGWGWRREEVRSSMKAD